MFKKPGGLAATIGGAGGNHKIWTIGIASKPL
jgi:hypothetical protein